MMMVMMMVMAAVATVEIIGASAREGAGRETGKGTHLGQNGKLLHLQGPSAGVVSAVE